MAVRCLCLVCFDGWDMPVATLAPHNADRAHHPHCRCAPGQICTDYQAAGVQLFSQVQAGAHKGLRPSLEPRCVLSPRMHLRQHAS